MPKQLAEEIPIAQTYLPLRIYVWLSLSIVVIPPIIRDTVRFINGGFKNLLNAAKDPNLSPKDNRHLAVVGYVLLVIFISLWMRASIILLKTTDKDRVNNILSWFFWTSFILGVIGLLPKQDWLNVATFGSVFILSAGIKYLLNSQYMSTTSRSSKVYPQNLRQRIFTSSPFYFILYAVPFGILESFQNTDHNHFSLSAALAAGVPFGLLMTFFTKKRLKKTFADIGLPDSQNRKKLFSAIKTGILPKDKEVLEVMPAYLKKRLGRKQTEKYSLVFLLFIAAANSVFSIVNHSLLESLLGAFMFIFIIFIYRSNKRYRINMQKLLDELEQSDKK